MKYRSYIIASLLACSLVSCDRWVDNASTPKDTLTPEQIGRPRMLASTRGKDIVDGPLIANVRTLYGEAFGQAALALGAMSDELTEGRVPNVLLYRHLSTDAIESNSGSADGLWSKLQDYHARSRQLLDIEQGLPSPTTADDGAARIYARFTGHLHTAQALQLLAETFSTTPEAKGGAVRIAGKMIPQQTLLTSAEEHYRQAIEAIGSEGIKPYKGAVNPDLAQRSAYSLLLRLLMHQGRYSECASIVDKCLAETEAWEVVYNAQGADNPLYSALNSELRDVQVSPALEAARSNKAEQIALPLAHKIIDKKNPDVYNIYVSSLGRHNSLIVIDGKEVQLIRAELIARGAIAGDALALVNGVISKYDAESVETAPQTLERLAHLRRIYLALRGERTHDLRRGLGGDAHKAWTQRKNQWIPLPERELQGL